ncbi:MAG: 2-succinyl-5-enolpyruvyl-6-hydroxy-3-cyclohexene-1-carboxylic-acid synthase [Herpetosiphon sp.]
MTDALNPTYVYLGALVDELARGGVGHVVICPGSRSTPLALSFAGHPTIRSWVLVDERSAAFFALGIAKMTGLVVALVCTSGTAAANFFPAVAEAYLSRVPLLVMTADRPPELRDNGAPQTIDQNRLYGSHSKWYAEAALPEASNEQLRYVRTLAARAVATAATEPAGPVQLNIPLREPLTPGPIPDQPLPPPGERDAVAWHGRIDGVPYVRIGVATGFADGDAILALAGHLSTTERGLIVAGAGIDRALAQSLTELAALLGYPVLADPLSQLRAMNGDQRFVVDNYDAFLRDERVVNALAPTLVIRFGAMPTSKPLLLFLRAHAAAHQVIVDNPGGWREPSLRAGEMMHADPAAVVAALLRLVQPRSPGDWVATWQTVRESTEGVLRQHILNGSELFEGRLWLELAAVLPARSCMMVGNSMPIRDCDTFFPNIERPVTILGNRGANGIDGLISTALGLAAGGGEPVVLVLGDLSFYHDMNGLLAARLHDINITIVIINNDGGGIFHFLPQADYPEHFEQYFGTPTGLDFRSAVEMYGGRFSRTTSWPEVRALVAHSISAGGLNVIEIPTDRHRNVALHRALWPAVAREVASLLPSKIPQ